MAEREVCNDSAEQLQEFLEEEENCPNVSAHFESIFNAIPDALVITDTDRCIIMANPAVEKIFGYTLKEVIGKNTQQFYARKEDYEEQGRLRYSKQGGAELSEPYRMLYRRKNGEVFLSETVGSAVRDEKGNVIGYLGLMKDIDKEHKVREKLQETELTYHTIANFTYDWEYWLDSDGSLRYVSPSCERITGYKPEEFIRDPELLKRIVYPEDRELWEKHLAESEEDIQLRELQFRIQTREGRIAWIEHACQPVVEDDIGFIGFRSSNRDITKRKKVEEVLREALREIKELKGQLEVESHYLREEINLEHNFKNIIGNSNGLQYVLFKVEQIAASDTSVLVLGETGTGKELIARAIHHTSNRKNRPLVKLNCAVLPAELIESELFGHEKGAFTSAQAKRLGRFEIADGATIFLDEIGELPVALQAKLLRVLQDGEFERVGSSITIKVDVRVIAATNRNLEEDVKAGRFRKDLWYRLNVFPITVPPLRDRVEDVPLLVQHFIEVYARKMGKDIRTVPEKAMRKLKQYHWPGNVRELENVIERAVINTPGTKLNLVDNLYTAEGDVPSPFKPLKEMEREYILKVLNQVNWKVSGKNSASEILQIDRSTLRARMKKLGISKPG